jgi:hypothetical protein
VKELAGFVEMEMARIDPSFSTFFGVHTKNRLRPRRLLRRKMTTAPTMPSTTPWPCGLTI